MHPQRMLFSQACTRLATSFGVVIIL